MKLNRCSTEEYQMAESHTGKETRPSECRWQWYILGRLISHWQWHQDLSLLLVLAFFFIGTNGQPWGFLSLFSKDLLCIQHSACMYGHMPEEGARFPLQMIVSHQVVVGNWNKDLWKSSWCLSLQPLVLAFCEDMLLEWTPCSTEI